MQDSPVPVSKKNESNGARNLFLGLLGLAIATLVFALGFIGGVTSRSGLTFSGASPLVRNNNIEGTPAAKVSSGKVNQALIDDAMTRLRSQFYGDLPSDDALTDGALRGMVNTYGDQFTQYVEPKFAKLLAEDSNGSFEGIGATLRQGRTNGGVQIIRIFEGSPAQKGGVQVGDTIVQVNDTKIGDLGATEVAALVRGPGGTNVKLMIRREGNPKPIELNLIRARIVIPVVTQKALELNGKKIGYVQLNDFSANSSRQLEDAISEQLKTNPAGLVLDLRGNGGGLLDQATRIGDIFLKDGVFIIQRDFNGKEERRNTTNTGIAQDIPLVVLVNGSSASASEVLAGAIQDAKRGILIGETTFGKGSVQLPQMLSNGGQLRITIQRWYTPANRAIHGEGIAPDYVVIRSQDDEKALRDPQLDAALEYLANGKTP